MIDICAYPDAAIVEALGLERMRGPGTAGLTSSQLLRYRLPKSGGTAKVEEASPEAVELPCINEGMVAEQRYRSMWAASIRGADSGFLDRIVRIDVEDGSRTAVWEREHCFAGEPLFVPHPGSNREAEGLILPVILDGAGERSALLVLNRKRSTRWPARICLISSTSTGGMSRGRNSRTPRDDIFIRQAAALPPHQGQITADTARTIDRATRNR